MGVLAAELATVDQLSNGMLNVRVGSAGWPRSSRAGKRITSSPKPQPVRETLEIVEGSWTNDLLECHGEFADFDRGVRRQAGAEVVPSDLLQRPQGFQAFCKRDRHIQPRRLDRNPGHC